MLRRKLLTGVAIAALGIVCACGPVPSEGSKEPPGSGDRTPLRHGGSIDDPRPMESVTGPLRFDGGCWVTTSGADRIALLFPREAALAEDGTISFGSRRLIEGGRYKFVGDLTEMAAGQEACGGIASAMMLGDAWPAESGGGGQ